jgi:hypothetical protein
LKPLLRYTLDVSAWLSLTRFDFPTYRWAFPWETPVEATSYMSDDHFQLFSIDRSVGHADK